MVASAGLQVGKDHAVLFGEMAGLRLDGQRTLHARLNQATHDGELPADTPTEQLAAYFAMVIQGMAVQAIATLAMKAWPTERH